MPPNADLSLLFRLRAENTQAKAVLADTRAAVNQLRQSFGPQLTQTVSLASDAFADLGGNLQNFVAQRLPVVGGLAVRLTQGLGGLAAEGDKTGQSLARVATSIESIAVQSGKSVPQITSFLTKFVQLEGQAQRDSAAIEFFGAKLGAELIPKLEQTGTELAAVSAESAAAGSSIAAIAGPIAIATIALAAMAAGVVIVTKNLVDLTKHTADFQGKMFDLAQQTGLAVETLSAFEVLARKTGGELRGTIIQALVAFQRKLDDAQDPLSKTAELFRKFNIETSDTETSLRSAFAALAAMPEGFAQTNAAAELFGARGGKQVLAILKEANGDIDGTIRRLREMEILISEDAARAADKLNDELALFEFQLRALGAAAGEEFIPALIEIVKSLGLMLRAIQPIISISATLISKALLPVTSTLKTMAVVVAFLTGNYKALAEAMKAIRDAPEIEPIKVPPLSSDPFSGTPSSQQAASEAVNEADVVIAAVKRKIAEQNQVLDEFFQQGRRNRAQQAEEIIAGNRQLLKAEQEGIDARLRQKEIELKALDQAQINRGEVVRRDTDDYRAITAEIVKLQQERLNKENEFNVQSRQLRAAAAKEAADARRNQIANETDLLTSEYDRAIKAVEAAIARQATEEADGLKVIELIEQEKINARVESLEKQREVGFLTIQNQKDLDNELAKLAQERTQLLDDQAERRFQRDRLAAERQRDILLANIDALIQIAQTRGQRLIDAQIALADARVITEEQAAKKILEINFGLIDAQIEATRTKLAATKSIVDVNQRVRTETDLNNQIRILTEERVSIEAAGEREIHEGRKRDLQNYRDYAEDLEDITERIVRIQRDAAEEVITLLRVGFARQRDIVAARKQLDLNAENERHRQAEQRIRDLERENRESRRTELEKLDIEFELNQLREAEAARHAKAIEAILLEARLAAKEAEPLGRLDLDLDNLREFASIIETSIVPLGDLLTHTFQQVADAIGQTIQNWVLLGETGPAIGRKLLAAALANLAREASVNAIKELALGFATLFFNPAESAAHFTAAGLWASIAGASALAGRGVAGDLFKQNSGGAGGPNTGAGTGPQELNPLTLQRNTSQQPQRVVVEVRVKDSEFGRAITSHVVKDVHTAGPIREALAGDGNLSR